MKRYVTDSIDTVNEKLTLIAKGDLDLFITVDTAEEAVEYMMNCHRYGFQRSVME